MAFTVNKKGFESIEDFVKRGRGCATPIPTPIQISRVDNEINSNKLRSRRFKTLQIELKFIHLTYGSLGQITLNQRAKQIQVLNDAYSQFGITFTYNENDVLFVDDYNWYYMGHRSQSERKAKLQLSSDSTQYLNFYTGGLQAGLLGWATFPFDLAGDPSLDGVVILDESLPGGNGDPYNLGMTAVHEIGHWLGLYHTFQDGCQGFGDHVDDTVAHKAPNYGKPKEEDNNSCNSNEQAPFHNFMNYTDDDWMNEFTSQQGNRMKEQIMMYRSELLSSNNV